ncbi:MAG: T9SS type A sorting domain-containing protein, partial [Bacteroidales bacterium]|nr:T9SS type A sorting domain-containing protein [Bacteroidales bacterium]
QGRVVATEKVEGLKSIDISSLPKGVYVVSDNYGATKKIVKK